MFDDRYTESLEFCLVADARLHQYLRSVDRSHRHNDLGRSAKPANLALVRDINGNSPLAVEYQAQDQRRREHGQIRTVHHREDIASEHGKPLAITNPQVVESGSAAALHHGSHCVVKSLYAERACTRHQSRRDRIRVRRRLNKKQSARSTSYRVRCAAPIFDASISGEDGLVIPRTIATLGSEEVPVVL